MFLRLFLELGSAMLFGTLCQEVDDLATSFFDPIDGCTIVTKAQYLDLLEIYCFLGPFTYLTDTFEFAVANTSRGDFEAVNTYFFE
jgi:hypothetical protein